MITSRRTSVPGGSAFRLFVRTGFVAAMALSSGALASGIPASTANAGSVTGFKARAGAPPVSVAVPRILSDDDENRYREIFRLQQDGKWPLADKHILALRNRLLIGHVLYQRFTHPTRYRASFQELRDWMVQFRDFPDAARIYDLAMKRKPKKAPDPLSPGSPLTAMVKLAGPTGLDPLSERAAAANARVYEQIDKGQPQAAEVVLNDPATQEALPIPAFDRTRSDLAMSYYVLGEDYKAYELAAASAERSGDVVAQAHWIAGLAAYRMRQMETAAFHFGQHALSPTAGPWNAAAGAYWTARVMLQIRQPARVERWLRAAAEHPRTFYGQIARRALGIETALDWSAPIISAEDIDRVLKLPGGQRAIALVQVGELVLAEEELRAHVWKLDSAHARSLLAVADAVGLPNTAVRAGSRLGQFGDEAGDRVLYPELPWVPRNGYKLDRALIYAFARQESMFYSRATSAVGAVGLMQLMPETAMQVSAEPEMRIKDQDTFYEPAVNLALGQQYLSWILARPDVAGNLFKAAIAYNAGIGNLRRWDRSVVHNGDPLLFIESIPSRETRNFVERILSNFWIYRERLGQPSPSLDAVVAGEWPRYVPYDRSDLVIAEDVPN
jgi:soluble lytic murein transglycosylase